MANEKNISVTEDIFDSMFDSAVITAGELQSRKISLARVLSEAESAVTLAEQQGKDDLAIKLQKRVDVLQELLDRAEEIAVPEDPEDEDAVDGIDGPTEDSGTRGGDNDAGNGAGKGKAKGKEKKEEGEEEEGEEPAEEEDTKKKEGDKPKPDSEEDESDSDNPSKKKDSGDTPPAGKPPKKPDEEPGDHPSKPPKEPTEEETEEGSEETPTEPGKPNPTKKPDEPDEPGDPGKTGDTPPETEEGDDPGDPPEDDESDFEPDEDDLETWDGKGPPPKKLYQNPFKRSPGGPDPDGPNPEDVESTFEAAKRILSKLEGDARKGAVQGLRDLMAKRGIPVSEALEEKLLQEEVDKLISQMSETEFNDLLASTMDMVNQVKPVSWSDDLDARAKEIKDDIGDPMKRAELEREDAEHVRADKAAARASEKERARYAKIKGLPGLDAFKRNLYKAVKDQVDISDDEVDSWAALDRRHEDDPSIIKKGFIRDGDELIPTVHVYFDQSGSWSNRDVEIGKRAVSVINDFHNRGEIDLKIFYMSAGGIFTTSEAAREHGAAEGWHAALQHIKSTKVKNVVILSDVDLDSYEWSNRPTGDNGVTRVDGCVWWLWKNSSVSKKALKELRGRRGSFQYMFVGGGYY